MPSRLQKPRDLFSYYVLHFESGVSANGKLESILRKLWTWRTTLQRVLTMRSALASVRNGLLASSTASVASWTASLRRRPSVRRATCNNPFTHVHLLHLLTHTTLLTWVAKENKKKQSNDHHELRDIVNQLGSISVNDSKT